MMRKYKNKKMAEGEIKTKKIIRCVRDQEIPGKGIFKAGQIIEDEKTIEYLKAGNPNFIEEEIKL